MSNSKSLDSGYIHKPNKFLKSFETELSGGLALDICIGGGRDALYLSSIEYEVTSYDVLPEFADKCNEIAKENSLKVKAYHKPLNEIIIPENSFDLITSSWVLHSIRKSESQILIQKMIGGLKQNGLLLLAVFSISDPFFKKNEGRVTFVEENTFFSKAHNKVVHYFSIEELLDLTKDIRLISISNKLSLDTGHGSLHYHGVMELAAIKISPIKIF